MHGGVIHLSTTRPMELLDLTSRAEQTVSDTGIRDGLYVLYNPHTTAGLTINEGADPDVRKDLLGGLNRMVPADYPYAHAEGNARSHLMAMLTGNSVTVFIEQGRLRLGTWQRIFFCEYDGPRERTIWWKICAG